MKYICFLLTLLIGTFFTFISCTSDDLSFEDIQGEWKVTHLRLEFSDGDVYDYYPDKGATGFYTLYIFSANTVTLTHEDRSSYSDYTYEFIGSSLKFKGTSSSEYEYMTGKVKDNKMTITTDYAGSPACREIVDLVKK